MTFTAIDFETATSKHNSACSVGIVTVENGIIVDEYQTLIQPPKNECTALNRTKQDLQKTLCSFFLKLKAD